MSYFDRSLFQNPLLEYFQWIIPKISCQLKNWGKHVRISYMAKLINTGVGKYNWIGRNSILLNSSIDDFTYVAEGAIIINSRIGKFCSIGPNTRIAPGKHPTSGFVSSHSSIYSNPPNLMRNFTDKQMFVYKSEVTIGNDVWIGGNVVIIDGIEIGDGAVIGANSVVTKNVEPYSIVGGVPAKFIKKRFDDTEIAFLIDFKWWDKSEDFIQENISSWWNIKDFTTKFKQD